MLATKHHQTLFGDQTFYRLDTLFGAVWSCLYVFDRVWSCFIKFEGHQTFKQELKTFLLFSCLMGDLLFVWTSAYQSCLKRASVPRLLSSLDQLFDPCLIKHVLTIWPLTSILACLVTKQCLVAKHLSFVRALTLQWIDRSNDRVFSCKLKERRLFNANFMLCCECCVKLIYLKVLLLLQMSRGVYILPKTIMYW